MERPVNYERWFFFRSVPEAAWVAIEEAISTIDQSIFAGQPHNRDPSGAASDYGGGFGLSTYRIGARGFSFVRPSTAVTMPL